MSLWITVIGLQEAERVTNEQSTFADQYILETIKFLSIPGQERKRSMRSFSDGRYVTYLTRNYYRSYCDNSMNWQVALWLHWA